MLISTLYAHNSSGCVYSFLFYNAECCKNPDLPYYCFIAIALILCSVMISVMKKDALSSWAIEMGPVGRSLVLLSLSSRIDVCAATFS